MGLIEWPILVVLFLMVSVLIDAEHLTKGQYIDDHQSRFFLRLLFIFTVSPNLLVFLSAGMFFASTFDSFLNWARDKELHHLGNTAKWDKFWSKRKKLYIGLKYITFISSIVLAVISYTL